MANNQEESNNEINKSISEIDEDNKKIRTVIKTLEELGWHPFIQKKIEEYCRRVRDGICVSYRINDKGERFNEETPSEYLHFKIGPKLFFYQDVVNTVIRNNDYNFSIRKKLIIFLGCKCVYCGNEDIDYLQLDHKNRDGNSERTEFKKRGLNLMLYYWNNLIEAYLKLQILCIKCHKLKTTYRIYQKDIDERIELEIKQKDKAK